MLLWITLAVAIVSWPVALGAALIDRVDPPASVAGSVLYMAAAGVCHQRPDRSFHTSGRQWPVCARCAGLYLAAPIGAVAALTRRRPARPDRARLALLVSVTTVPVALTWLTEAAVGIPVAGMWRAVTAAPAGAAIAFAVLTLLAPEREGNRVD